jgi:hypothetical protein
MKIKYKYNQKKQIKSIKVNQEILKILLKIRILKKEV